MSQIRIIRKGPVAELVLNRPDSLNVLSYQMSIELKQAAAELKADKAIACVIVSGAGDHFMGGGDIGYFKKLADTFVVEGTSAYPRDIFDNVHSAISDITTMGKPVIAKVKGAVAGFGLSLMLACDMAIAADNCMFSVAYCKIGTTPDGGMSYFLPRAVGQKKAMELALTGDFFSSEEAKQWGMLNTVVTVEGLNDTVDKLVARLCTGPRKVLARTKRMINQTYDVSLLERLDEEKNNFQLSMLEKDFFEGVTAFSERRKPLFEK